MKWKILRNSNILCILYDDDDKSSRQDMKWKINKIKIGMKNPPKREINLALGQ